MNDSPSREGWAGGRDDGHGAGDGSEGKVLATQTDLGSKRRNHDKSLALHSPALEKMESGAHWPARLGQ